MSSATPDNQGRADVVEVSGDQLSELVTPDKLPQVRAILSETIAEITEHHSGPLPRARDLAAYNDIDPGFAERIVRMAEKQQEFEHSLPREYLKREYGLKARGQLCALAVTIIVLAFAAYLATLGDTEMAGWVAIGTLVGLVSVLVSGRAIDAKGERRRTEANEENAEP